MHGTLHRIAGVSLAVKCSALVALFLGLAISHRSTAAPEVPHVLGDVHADRASLVFLADASPAPVGAPSPSNAPSAAPAVANAPTAPAGASAASPASTSKTDPSPFDPFANGIDFTALSEFATLAYHAIVSGQWGLVAVLLLILAVSAIRKWGGEKFPFLKSDEGSALLVLVLGAGGALAHAAIAGAAITWALVGTGLGIGFFAAGGFSTLTRILPWVISKLPAKFAFLAVPLTLALRLMGSSRLAIDKAKAAGDSAVAASPGTGVSGIVGK